MLPVVVERVVGVCTVQSVGQDRQSGGAGEEGGRAVWATGEARESVGCIDGEEGSEGSMIGGVIGCGGKVDGRVVSKLVGPEGYGVGNDWRNDFGRGKGAEPRSGIG